MDPKRVLIIEPVTLKGGQVLQRWSYVWKLGKAGHDMILIEHKNRQYIIAAGHTVETPIPAPTADKLIGLDSCFADLEQNLQEVHRSETRMFSVYRCRHGNYFLEDVRGGTAVFSLWIFLGIVEKQPAGSWEDIWKGYHYLPAEAVYYLGIGR